MSTSVSVSQVKNCDICHYVERKDTPVVAFYDAKTFNGQWANVCVEHFWSDTEAGLSGLGLGRGQYLNYIDLGEDDAARVAKARTEQGAGF